MFSCQQLTVRLYWRCQRTVGWSRQTSVARGPSWSAMPLFHGTEPNPKTSCCSTNSEKSHCCCHLPNNFSSRRIFPIFHNGPRDVSPNCSFSRGSPDPDPTYMVLLANPSPYITRHLNRLGRFGNTHRHTDTDHATAVSVGRILCCMRHTA